MNMNMNMNILHTFLKTDKIRKSSRKENINKIFNFAVNKLKTQIVPIGLHPSELCQGNIINEMINNKIIPQPKQKPDKLEDLVKYKLNNQEVNMSGEDLATFLSHFDIWKKIVENKIPYSLIIEDDVVFDEEKTLNAIHNLRDGDNKPEKFWLVSLLNDFDNTIQNTRKYNEEYHHITTITPNTQKFYILTYEGAKILLNKLFPIHNPLAFSINRELMVSKKGYLLKKNIANINPYIDLIIPLKPVQKIDEIGAFYLASIERSREKRGENIENLKKFIKDTYGKDLNISGVDGAKLTQDELVELVTDNVIDPSPNADISLNNAGRLVFMNEFPNRDPFMNTGEIGCFLSHYNIWKDIIEKEIPYSIVFEDDAKINTKIFPEHLKIIMNNAPENFGVISMYKHESQLSRKFIPYNNLFETIDRKVWGTTAYIVSLESVKAFMDDLVPIKHPVDFAIHNYVESKKNGYMYKERIIQPYDDISVIKH